MSDFFSSFLSSDALFTSDFFSGSAFFTSFLTTSFFSSCFTVSSFPFSSVSCILFSSVSAATVFSCPFSLFVSLFSSTVFFTSFLTSSFFAFSLTATFSLAEVFSAFSSFFFGVSAFFVSFFFACSLFLRLAKCSFACFNKKPIASSSITLCEPLTSNPFSCSNVTTSLFCKSGNCLCILLTISYIFIFAI